MRLFSCVLAMLMVCITAVPATALTQEEILQRRLEKMRQAAPTIHAEEQQRQELRERDAAAVGTAPVKSAEPPLTIPDPVRPPSPEPHGVWQGKKPAAPAPATPAAAPTRAQTPPSPPVTQPAAVPTPARADQSPTRDPATARSLAAMAAKAAAGGDNKTALTMLGEAVAADPANPDLHNNRGNIQSNLGRFKEALTDYDRAIAMKSTDATYFTNRGLAHERLGNQEKACADYKKACELGDCEFFKSYKAEGHCR